MNPVCATTNPEFISQYFTLRPGNVASGTLWPISHSPPFNNQCHCRHMSLFKVCLQLSFQNEMTAVILSPSTPEPAFVHKAPRSGKDDLHLAGYTLGTTLRATGEPLASDQCRCCAVLPLWFLSLQIHAFGNSSCKSVRVGHSPLVIVVPLTVLEAHTQWEEEEADRCEGFILQLD